MPGFKENLTVLSSDDVLEIVFDSFEISQQNGLIQEELFELLAKKFPFLRVEADAIEELTELFLERTLSFLSNGKYHTASTQTSIRDTAKVYISTLKEFLNDKKKSMLADSRLFPAEIFSKILDQDYYYLAKPYVTRPHSTEGNKYTSYIKKYFIDENLTKNAYLRAIMMDVQVAFYAAMKQNGILLDSDQSLQELQHIYGTLTFPSNLSLSDRTKLVLVAHAWETKHAGQSFWKSAKRS